MSSNIFSLNEAALAYALAAERILGPDAAFLEAHPAVIPLFVSHLFQSLEISIKHVGLAAGLFSERESRDRARRSGHGIRELASLAVERLGGEHPSSNPLTMAMTFANTETQSITIIEKMIYGPEFERTRNAYTSRGLGYSEVANGDFALINGVKKWVEVIKQTAESLPKTVEIVTQWKNSPSHSKHFAIWVKSSSSIDG